MVDIGKIVGVYGLDGHLKVTSLSDFPERFDPGQPVWIEGEKFKIHRSHWYKLQVRVKLTAHRSIEDAEPLIGKIMQIPADARPELEEDEFYFDQIQGYQVVDQHGQPIGQIDNLLHMPTDDILVVGPILIPCRKEFITRIDPAARLVTVHLLPGMRPEEEA